MDKETKNSGRVSIRIPPNELIAIDSIAKKEGVKRSCVIRSILRASLSSYTPTKGKK